MDHSGGHGKRDHPCSRIPEKVMFLRIKRCPQAACLVEAVGQDFLLDGAAEASLLELEMPRCLESSG